MQPSTVADVELHARRKVARRILPFVFVLYIIAYLDRANVAFASVAMISERFWPLWVSGLQLTALLGHLLKGVESDLLPTAYAAALHFWSYPILIILAVGTWRTHQSTLKRRNLVPNQ